VTPSGPSDPVSGVTWTPVPSTKARKSWTTPPQVTMFSARNSGVNSPGKPMSTSTGWAEVLRKVNTQVASAEYASSPSAGSLMVTSSAAISTSALSIG